MTENRKVVWGDECVDLVDREMGTTEFRGFGGMTWLTGGIGDKG